MDRDEPVIPLANARSEIPSMDVSQSIMVGVHRSECERQTNLEQIFVRCHQSGCSFRVNSYIGSQNANTWGKFLSAREMSMNR